MLLIKNGTVKTMAGDDIINGSVLIGDDGKIVTVGTDISAPEGAEVIDAAGRLVTPGCVPRWRPGIWSPKSPVQNSANPVHNPANILIPM